MENQGKSGGGKKICFFSPLLPQHFPHSSPFFLFIIYFFVLSSSAQLLGAPSNPRYQELAQRQEQQQLQGITGVNPPGSQNTTDRFTEKIDQLAQACLNSPPRSRAEICNGILEFKQVGEDIIESVKAYISLGPYEYAALTTLNTLITGRLRIRTAPYVTRGGSRYNWVYDIQRDSASVTMEITY